MSWRISTKRSLLCVTALDRCGVRRRHEERLWQRITSVCKPCVRGRLRRNLRCFCALHSGVQTKVPFMTANRVNWFETLEGFVQFYPKLTATIALGAMSAIARMIPGNGPSVNNAPTSVMRAPRLVASAKSSATKRRTGRKTPKPAARNVFKWAGRRRKAS